MSVRTCSLSTLPIAARIAAESVPLLLSLRCLPTGGMDLDCTAQSAGRSFATPVADAMRPALKLQRSAAWSLLCNGLCCIRRCVRNQRQTGADMMFIHRAICLAGTAVYSLHKSSTR